MYLFSCQPKHKEPQKKLKECNTIVFYSFQNLKTFTVRKYITLELDILFSLLLDQVPHVAVVVPVPYDHLYAEGVDGPHSQQVAVEMLSKFF